MRRKRELKREDATIEAWKVVVCACEWHEARKAAREIPGMRPSEVSERLTKSIYALDAAVAEFRAAQKAAA